jgi:RHS repeat-associated protein
LGIEYKDGQIESIMHPEGRAVWFDKPEDQEPAKFIYEYNLKDHLGNVRVVFADKNEDGFIHPFFHHGTLGGWFGNNYQDAENHEIIQENHYYPFGMAMEGAWENVVPEVAQDYLYNGKEMQSDFGLDWLDYGARYYDAAIGRWGQVDPLAELDHNVAWSPYNYVVNNPISNFDPDGMDWFRNEDGEEYWSDRSEAEEGEEHLGEYHIVEGKYGYVVHHQNEVIATVSKSTGDYAEAYTRQVQHMTVEEQLGADNSRASEALLATGDLIQNALLTFAPVPKAATSAKSFGVANVFALLKAGNAMDRGGFTAVGRALQKHGSRAGSKFPKATGTASAINAQGETVLRGILTNPNTTVVSRHHARFGNVIEYKLPGGQGARFIVPPP